MNLYKMTYTDRLTQNEVKPQFKSLFQWKELLCNKRLEVARSIKTNEWNKKDICEILKNLKNNKARDPMGLANELFKDGVIGSDLKDSLVMFLNQVKDKLNLPKLAYLANITSIYKGKNDKKDLDNDRGVFTLTVLRMILDKVIYLEEYETLDKNMSDSNAGARKDRNCRNHDLL